MLSIFASAMFWSLEHCPLISLPKMHSYFCSSYLLMFLIIIIFISLDMSYALNLYANCSESVKCGNLEDIKYPFWGVNRAADCGKPDFELTCQENVPKFTIASQSYRVLDIYPERETLRIAREDYWDTNACPRVLSNTTLNFAVFDYQSGLRNLTLLYGCSSSFMMPIPNIFSQESCFINQTSINLFYSTINISVNPLIGSCKDRVHLPVLETNAEALEQRSKRLVDAINEGFDVRWLEDTSRDCNACEVSDGACGYNRTLSRFHCFCPDMSISNTTCSMVSQSESSSDKKPVVIGAAVGGAAVICIVAGIFSFFLFNRRKQAVVLSKSKGTSIPTSSQGMADTTTTNFSRSTPYTSMSSDPEKGSNYFGVMVFKYSELEEATRCFDPSRELGDGGFGTVYYGELADGRVVAVKRLHENNYKRVTQFMNEVEIITRLKYPNLVQLYGCTSRRSRELILVYEYIPNGTVADHLHGKRAETSLLAWHLRLSIAIETAAALAYLHASDIIHRDVKTNNILLDNNFTVKVADFGLSRLFPNDVTHVSTAPQGTPGYVDPEYYKCYQLTDKSDVYSFGVVLIELISSKQAVDISRHRQDVNLATMAIKKIQNHSLNELVDLSLGFESDFSVQRTMTLVAELAFRCLQEERDMRPCMEEVHNVLEGIKNEGLNAEVMDIDGEDDVSLLKSDPGPLSPDSDKGIRSSITSEKLRQIRSM